MGDITARIGRMEEAHGLLAGKVEELLISGETKETTGAKAFSPVPIAQRSRENSKADYASPRKFRGRKSYLAEQHEQWIKTEEQVDEDSDGEDNVTHTLRDSSARYTAVIKGNVKEQWIVVTVDERCIAVIKSNVKDHSGKEEDHERWLATLQSEFNLNDFSAIITDDENVWKKYLADIKAQAQTPSKELALFRGHSERRLGSKSKSQGAVDAKVPKEVRRH